MATLTTSWANYGGTTWSSSGGSTVYFWIDAKYNSQDIAKNTTTIEVRLTSTADHQNGNGGSGYGFSCTYCTGKSGGEVWYYANETILSSPATEITHNDNGTKTVTINARAYNNYLGFDKYFSATFDLPSIPRAATISSAQDFNDEQNPVLNYSNPAKNSVASLQACLSFDGTTDHIAYRDISKTGTSYTFNLTNAEREVLYKNTVDTNKKLITYIVKTVIGANTYYKKIEKYLTITNANPTGSVALTEMNSTVINKVGGNTAQHVIKHISNIKAVLTSTGKKSATIKSVNLSCGAASSNGASTYTFNAVAANGIKYTITDSRGFKTEQTVPFANFVEYVVPKIVYSDFERVSLDSTNIKLNATIDCYTGEIKGALNTFAITYSGSNGKSGTITSYSADDNQIVISDLVLLDQAGTNEIPTFTLSVVDAFSSATASNVVVLMVPSFDAGENDFQVNGTLYVADAKGNNKVDILSTLKSTQTTANNAKTAADAAPKVFVQSAQPTATKKGDIWFKI